MEAFTFNSGAKYKAGGYQRSLIAKNLTFLMITVAPNKVFFASLPDIWRQYRLPKVKTNATAQAWNSAPMQFWQNQLNFAVWCATAGCGVSVDDHLNGPESHATPLIQSVYLFHFYYTTRRILTEMKCTLPQDASWDPLNNTYDRRAYERLCQEFGVDPKTDWRQKEYPHSRGLGDVHTKGHVAWTQTEFRHDSQAQHVASINAGSLDPEHMTFGSEVAGGRHCGVSSCDWLPPKKAHIEFIEQDPGVDGSWSTFVLDSSKGLTQAGMARINDSIRTYVWALLGAQAQTKSRIVGKAAAGGFEAQKQFLALVEDAINSPVDIQASIARYQSVLQYAGSELNMVFGTGLYMAPGDMLLNINPGIAGYNNKIQKAPAGLPIGTVDSKAVINSAPVQGLQHGSFDDGKIAGPPLGDRPTPTGSSTLPAAHVAAARAHSEEKKALVVGGIAVGLVALWLALR